MNTMITKTALLSAAILFGMNASAAPSLPLQPGYAVHTFGVSPDANNGDGNYTVRVYDTTGREYVSYDPDVPNPPPRPTVSFAKTYVNPQWDVNTIGNVYGIAIDKNKNIFVTASANWSPGYVGEGDSSTSSVPVKYGLKGGGDTNDSAGVVYKLDATTIFKLSTTTLQPLVKKKYLGANCQGTVSSQPNVLNTCSYLALSSSIIHLFHSEYSSDSTFNVSTSSFIFINLL